MTKACKFSAITRINLKMDYNVALLSNLNLYFAILLIVSISSNQKFSI